MPKKTIFVIIAIAILSGIGYFIYQSKTDISDIENKVVIDPLNATYRIEGEEITLISGRSEKGIIITQYFGNEAKADLNNDGSGDSAFLLTQDGGGSGTFYYLAALVSNKQEFVGTNAVFLGDRIAPQTTEFKNGMIVVNYADRNPGEPFTTPPSVGVSKYFEVINNELKEITLRMTEAEARLIAQESCIKDGEALGNGVYNENSQTWWFDANLNATQEGCNPACVVSEETKTAEINWRCTGLITP